MTAKLNPLFAASHSGRGIVKQPTIWKERFIDAVLFSMAALSMTALALRLLGR